MLERVAASKSYGIVGETWLIDEHAIHSLSLSATIRRAMGKVASKAGPCTAGGLQFYLKGLLRAERATEGCNAPGTIKSLAVAVGKEKLLNYAP